ncbi:single-stranded DNA-binding protein (plasmid) [Borreliella bissettiae]|uniref:Single-stranded DNA-binding protein n=1 Tax=Borrelia bissettiae TaxID=64897 RepID=A0A1L8Z8L1_BORBI|nr:ERF family protein [Borreliella bissettiae]OJH14076.1 single-stranded DNA-binding protein [Borreliella bissettiae]
MENLKNNNPQEINQAEIDFLRDMKTLRMNLAGIDKNLKGYGYKYQNFNEILREIKNVINKHNLALDFKQAPVSVKEDGQKEHFLRTTFYSTNTGYKDSFDAPMFTENLKWNNENGSKNVNTVPQLVGSSITYFKRYALVAYLNIESEVDTDAAPIYNNHENENSMPSKQAGVNQKQEQKQNQIKNFDKKLKMGRYYCYELFRSALFNIKNWVNNEEEKNNINALIRALCFENEADLDEIFDDNPGFKSIQYWANILLEYFKKTNKLDELNKFENFMHDNNDVYETSVLKFFCMLKKERQFDYIFAV